MNRLERFIAVGILVVSAMAFGGYAIGSSSVPSEAEVNRVRDQARAEAEQAAVERVYEESRERGYKRGLARGRREAKRAGVERPPPDPEVGCGEGQIFDEIRGCVPAAGDEQQGTEPDASGSGPCPSGEVPLAAGGCGPPAPTEQGE